MMTDSKWVIGIIGGILGFIVSQLISYYFFKVNLDTTKDIQMVQLARDYAKEFYDDGNYPVYKDIRTSIESCEKLYRSWDGQFSHDQINQYLGFFDDLGFYHKKGALDLDIINQLFGAYIIEAYEYKEIHKYIDEFQKNTKQKSAFENFRAVARQLEELPERKDEVEIARKCSKRGS